MKIRKTIKKWTTTGANGCPHDDLWRAISVLEKRTRHLTRLKKVPPFTAPADDELTDPSPEEYLVIPANTAEFIRVVDLKHILRELYDITDKRLQPGYRVALLDALEVVTTVLDAENEQRP